MDGVVGLPTTDRDPESLIADLALEEPRPELQRVGSYDLVRVLGRGGMGTVYLARHHLIGSHVAVKILHGEYCRDPTIVRRFFAEARAVNLIGHENIIKIFDLAATDDGRFYYVMEYLEGYTLGEAVPKSIALELIAPALLQVLDALQAAHERSVVHRDLKPANILLAKQGDRTVAKVLDFGIAKLNSVEASWHTQTGQILGTPQYMSPEQCLGGVVDARSDLYSLGAIMYRLATGRVPFEASSIPQIMFAHVSQPPTPPRDLDPTISPAFEALILRALAKDPADRFADAAAMASAFREALASSNGLAKTAAHGVSRGLARPAIHPEAPKNPTQAPSAPPLEAPSRAPSSPNPHVTPRNFELFTGRPSSPPAAPEGSPSDREAAAEPLEDKPMRAARPRTQSSIDRYGTGQTFELSSIKPAGRGSSSSHEVHVRISDPAGFMTRLLDKEISRSGIFVAAEQSLPLNSFIDLVIWSPNGAHHSAVCARVVRLVDEDEAKHWGGRPGMAIEILELGPEVRASLEGLLSPHGRTTRSDPPRRTSDDPQPDDLVQLIERFHKVTDPYALLSIPLHADAAAAQRSAKRAIQRLDPAAHLDPSPRQIAHLEEIQRRVEAALGLLTDPKRRAEYDASVHNYLGIATAIGHGIDVHLLANVRASFLLTHPDAERRAREHTHLAVAAQCGGRLVEARGEFEQALMLDPLDLELQRRYWALRHAMMSPGTAVTHAASSVPPDSRPPEDITVYRSTVPSHAPESARPSAQPAEARRSWTPDLHRRSK